MLNDKLITPVVYVHNDVFSHEKYGSKTSHLQSLVNFLIESGIFDIEVDEAKRFKYLDYELVCSMRIYTVISTGKEIKAVEVCPYVDENNRTIESKL